MNRHLLRLVGAISIEARIDIHKLHVLQYLLHCPVITSRLLCFKNQCVPDPVGYVRDIHRILDKNKLSEYLNYFHETSTFPTKKIWKRIIQKSVFEHEEAKWETSISLTPEIIHFLQIHPTLNMHKAWEIAHFTPLLKERAILSLVFALRGGHGHLTDCAPL